jgi:hypothetical protein
MTVICYDCIHTGVGLIQNCCYRERFLCNSEIWCVCFCVCLLELFVRSSYQHYLQHQFTVHVQIERIQKCAAAAAAPAAAEEKFS